jgi:hypothetical protein
VTKYLSKTLRDGIDAYDYWTDERPGRILQREAR